MFLGIELVLVTFHLHLMSPYNDLKLIPCKKPLGLISAIIIRAPPHLILLPGSLALLPGVAPNQVAKRSLLWDIDEPINPSNIVYIIIRALRRAALGEMPACTAKYLLSTTAASGILAKRSRKRS